MVRNVKKLFSIILAVVVIMSGTLILPPKASAVTEATISGRISLPSGVNAPAGGIVGTVDIYPDNNEGSYYTVFEIDPGSNYANYTVAVPAEALDYRVSYYLYENNPGFINQGYYSSGGTTTDYYSATLLDASDGNLTNINLTINTGNTISGTISLPAGVNAPYGGIEGSIDIIPQDNEGYYYSNFEIGEGENSASYTVTVPKDCGECLVAYYLYNNFYGYYREAYYTSGGTSTNYFLAKPVNANSGNIAGINLTVLTQAVTPDDHGNTIASATEISLGTNISGQISPAGDVDYFKFTPDHTDSYTFTTISDVDTYGVLFNAQGSFLTEDDDDGYGYNFLITQTLQAGQDYYIMVEMYDSDETGNYQLSVTGTAADDHSNTMDSATPIYLGTNVAGQINPAGDVDFFKFTPSQSGDYSFTTISDYDTCGSLFNTQGSMITENDDNGYDYNFLITQTLQAGQAYYIKVELYDSEEIGNYELCVFKQNQVPVSDVFLDQSSLTLVVGQSQQLFATVLPNNATDKSVTWTVYSQSGSNIATVSDTGVITAENPGTAVIRVTSNSDPSKYAEVNVSVVDGITISGTISLPGGQTAPAGGIEGSVNIILPNSFFDGYYAPFVIPQGSSSANYTLSIPQDGSSAEYLMRYTLYDNYNGYLGYGYYSQSQTTAEYVSAAPVTVNTNNVLGINFTVLPSMTDDIGNTIDAAAPISIGADISGRLNPQGDIDVFKFTPAHSGSYTFRTVCDKDTYEILTNANGDVLKDDGEGNNSELFYLITYDCEAGQDYYYHVRMFNSFSQGGYHLSLTENSTTPVSVEAVTLNKSNTSLSIGQTEQLTATITPDNATDKSVLWSIMGQSGNNIITVSNTGLVMAMNTGTALVRAASNSDPTKYAECSVTVTAGADKSALLTAIASAQALHDAATEGTDVGQYAIGSKAILQAAITAAQTVANDGAANAAQISQALTNLANAINTFEAGKVPAAGYSAVPIAELGINPNDNESAGLFIGLKDLKDSGNNVLDNAKISGYQIEVNFDPSKVSIPYAIDTTNSGALFTQNSKIQPGLGTILVSCASGGAIDDYNHLFFIPVRLRGSALDQTAVSVTFKNVRDVNLHTIQIPALQNLKFQRGKIFNENLAASIPNIGDAIAGLQFLAKSRDAGFEFDKVNPVNMASIVESDLNSNLAKSDIKDIIALMQYTVDLRDNLFNPSTPSAEVTESPVVTDSLKEGDTSIAGTAPIAAKILLSINGVTKPPVTADMNGHWTVATGVPLVQGDVISVTAQSAEKLVSQPYNVTVSGPDVQALDPGTVIGEFEHWKINTTGLEPLTDYEISLSDNTIYPVTTDDSRSILFTEAQMEKLALLGAETIEIRRPANSTASASPFVTLLEVSSMGAAPVGLTRDPGSNGYNTGDELIQGGDVSGLPYEIKIGTDPWTGEINHQPHVSVVNSGDLINLTIPAEDTDLFVRLQGNSDKVPGAASAVPNGTGGPVDIPVTGITVQSAGNVSSVQEGSTLQMSAVVLPDNATNKTVTWSVSTLGGGTAVIDASTGFLAALSPGTVTVTAKNAASGVTGTRVITITPDPHLNVTSSAFADGGIIPNVYVLSGGENGYTVSGAANKSIPLNWGTAAPAGHSFFIIMTDIDAGNWNHWVVKNIPNNITSINAGASATCDQPGIMPAGSAELLTSWGSYDGFNRGYYGPKPPQGTGTHRYTIEVFELDTPTINTSDESFDGYTYSQLRQKIDSHIVKSGQITGNYAAP